jgi:lysophospholipase L1-like esterase
MREAFALLFSKIKAQYPDCMIVCLTNLEDPKRDFTPGWPSNNRLGVSTAEWNRAIAELSTHFDCLTVDLQDCGINYENAAKYSVDGGLHPNDAGMTLIAKKVVKELANAMNEPVTNNE